MNPYLKNCKYIRKKYGSRSTQTILSTEGLPQSDASEDFVGPPAPDFVGPPAPTTKGVMTGTEGWATYFWDKDKEIISFVNPSSGKKISYDNSVADEKKMYKKLSTTPKIKWKASTKTAMDKQKSQAPRPSRTSSEESDTPPAYEEDNFFKDNMGLIIGGTTAVIALPITIALIVRSVRRRKSKKTRG